MADTAKIRKTALEASALLKRLLDGPKLSNEEAQAIYEEMQEKVEWIAENAKRKRTEADRARDRRRSRKGVDPAKIAEMKRRMEKMQ